MRMVSTALEREFRAVYQEPGVRYFRLACWLAAFGFGAFLFLDIVRGAEPALRWANLVRGVVATAFLVLGVVSTIDRAFLARHYIVAFNLAAFVGVEFAAWSPVAVFGSSQAKIELLYWSINSSLISAMMVLYGLSRLSAGNTAAIAAIGCATGVATVFFVSAFDWYYVSRLLLHLALFNVLAFSLRKTIERRERDLFVLAKDNLSKNVYAKQLEAAKARAEEGDAIKLRFLENMSHEFRTPMNGVIQALEMAQRSAKGNLVWLIVRAIDSGHKLVATLDGILDYTRWTQKDLAPSPRTVRVSSSIRDVVARHEQGLEERGIVLALRLDLAESNDVVRIDGTMLTAVVDRLLDNASRFTTCGRIDVSVELRRRLDSPFPAATLVVSVTDTGIGIPAGQREAIFAPFHQIDSASDRRVGGAGLGLAIVRRLVAVMGGTIGLVSRVNVGSTFTTELPIDICTDDAPQQPLFSAPDGSTGRIATVQPALGGSVLLVEDNELNGDLAEELLRSLGIRVARASDGREACRMAAGGTFHVILMDCQMPVMDGYEATRSIRQAELAVGRRPVPIVAVTANALEGDRERCLEAGMNDYLSKPYTAAQMRSKLARWLGSTVGQAKMAEP